MRLRSSDGSGNSSNGEGLILGGPVLDAKARTGEKPPISAKEYRKKHPMLPRYTALARRALSLPGPSRNSAKHKWQELRAERGAITVKSKPRGSFNPFHKTYEGHKDDGNNRDRQRMLAHAGIAVSGALLALNGGAPSEALDDARSIADKLPFIELSESKSNTGNANVTFEAPDSGSGEVVLGAPTPETTASAPEQVTNTADLAGTIICSGELATVIIEASDLPNPEASTPSAFVAAERVTGEPWRDTPNGEAVWTEIQNEVNGHQVTQEAGAQFQIPTGCTGF